MTSHAGLSLTAFALLQLLVLIHPLEAASSHWAVSGSYLGLKTAENRGTGFAKVQEEYCLDDGRTSDRYHTERADGSWWPIGTVCCDSSGRGSRPNCVSGDYETAKAHCESKGKSLCTLAQLKHGAGEASGCGFDASLVWSKDSCEAIASEQQATVTYVKKEGVLKLRLEAIHTSDGAHVDLAMKLKQHQSIIVTTLASHFSLRSMKIYDISMAGRRLSRTETVNIRFSGETAVAKTIANPIAEGFVVALQAALSAVSAGLSVTGAHVEWLSPTSDLDSTESNNNIVPIIVVSLMVAFAAVGCALVMIKIFRKQAQKTDTVSDGDSTVVQADLVGQDATKNKPKDSTDDEVNSVDSTKSPASGAEGNEDTISTEDRDGKTLHDDGVVIEM